MVSKSLLYQIKEFIFSDFRTKICFIFGPILGKIWTGEHGMSIDEASVGGGCVQAYTLIYTLLYHIKEFDFLISEQKSVLFLVQF